MTSMTLDRASAPAASVRARIPDDKAMLRTAAELTRDLVQPRAGIYWADLIASSVVGYGALALAIGTASTAVMIVAGVVSMLALYRGMSMIHELTHVWQAQQGVNLLFAKLKAGDTPASYAYRVEPTCRWDALNIEQQAMVMEHRFHCRRGRPTPGDQGFYDTVCPFET